MDEVPSGPTAISRRNNRLELLEWFRTQATNTSTTIRSIH